jgi:phage head maturation protease
MKVEIRADGVHISGYVNVTEKMSRPVITAKGQKVVEVIEPRAFERAIEKADNVAMTKDHDPNVVLAETRAGNLTVYEDAIGLHADAVVTDENTVAEARAGKIKGWSFGMRQIVDKIEERADALPLRRVSAFDLDHITLVVNKTPVYAATSVEMRADDDVAEIECRAMEETPTVIETKPKFDNSDYRNRITALSGKKEG